MKNDAPKRLMSYYRIGHANGLLNQLLLSCHRKIVCIGGFIMTSVEGKESVVFLVVQVYSVS